MNSELFLGSQKGENLSELKKKNWTVPHFCGCIRVFGEVATSPTSQTVSAALRLFVYSKVPSVRQYSIILEVILGPSSHNSGRKPFLLSNKGTLNKYEMEFTTHMKTYK